MQIFPVKSKTKNIFNILCNFNLLFNVCIPLRNDIETDDIVMRELKLSNQSKKIFNKLKSSGFDKNLLKKLCSHIKISITKGKWKFFEEKEVLNMYSESGFLSIDDNCVLFSNDLLSDDTLMALRKYREHLDEENSIYINQKKDIVITVMAE